MMIDDADDVMNDWVFVVNCFDRSKLMVNKYVVENGCEREPSLLIATKNVMLEFGKDFDLSERIDHV